jgi:hypothetical protein
MLRTGTRSLLALPSAGLTHLVKMNDSAPIRHLRHDFHPAVDAWFAAAFPAATEAKLRASPLIQAGRPILVAAPTGSGKTRTALLAQSTTLAIERRPIRHGDTSTGRAGRPGMASLSGGTAALSSTTAPSAKACASAPTQRLGVRAGLQ